MNAKKRKGYIYIEISEDVKIDVDELLEEVKDEDLLDELKERKLLNDKEYEKPIPREGQQLRKLLCDICDISYHSSDNQILNSLKERLL